jgi:hypothetical protein
LRLSLGNVGPKFATKEAMHNHLWRAFRLAVHGLVIFELSYIILANAFLNLGGIQKVFEQTTELQGTIGSGWTLWPGRVHIEDARVVFSDHNVQWSLDTERLQIDVAFLPLLSKTFYATRVRGEGSVFRVRHRVPLTDAALPSTIALPPIPEFSSPAILYAHVPSAPRTDLWRIHIEDVDVGVVEIWAQQIRYLGAARARGAFRLHAGYHLWVGPASLDLEPGELRVGRGLVSPQFGGHIACVVHPFFVNGPVGREIFRFFSASVDLHGQHLRLESLGPFLPPGTTLRSSGGHFHAVASAHRGVISQASRFELHATDPAVAHRGWALQSKQLELVAHGSEAGTGEATLDVQQGRASHGRASLTLEAGHVGLRTPSLDTTASWTLSNADVTLTSLAIPRLGDFDDLASPHGVRLDSGSASAHVSGRYAAKTVQGDVRVALSEARGRTGDVAWELDGGAQLSIGPRAMAALSDGSSDLAFQGRLALSANSTRVEANDASLDAHALLEHARGSGHISANTGQLSLRRDTLRVASRAALDIELAGIDLERGTVYASAAGELVALEAKFGPSMRGRAKRIHVASEVSMEEGAVADGWLDLAIPVLSLRSGDTDGVAIAHVRLEAEQLDASRRSGSATAVVSLKDLWVGHAAGRPKCLWARAARAIVRAKLGFTDLGQAVVGASGNVERGRVRWDDFEVSGNTRLAVRNLLPSSEPIAVDLGATDVRMVSGASPVDGWAVSIPNVRVTSTLRSRSGNLAGPVRVRARLVQGRIGATPVRAELNADWKLDSINLERGELAGAGDLRVEHADIGEGNTRVKGWWGRVQFPSVRWTAQQNVDGAGEFVATFRDGLPALRMFAASGDLPGWVPTVLPLHELEARGRFRRSCRVTDIYFEQASGGPLVAAGRIQSEPSDTRGAFLIQWESPLRLSIGLVTFGGEVGVSILAGNDWLDEQSKTIDDWGRRVACQSPPDGCSGTDADEPPTVGNWVAAWVVPSSSTP